MTFEELTHNKIIENLHVWIFLIALYEGIVPVCWTFVMDPDSDGKLNHSFCALYTQCLLKKRLLLVTTPRSAEKDTPWLIGSKVLTSLAVIADRDLSHTHYVSGKGHRLGCQASCTVLLQYELTLIRVPGIMFQPMGLDMPHPIRAQQLYSYLHLYW